MKIAKKEPVEQRESMFAVPVQTLVGVESNKTLDTSTLDFNKITDLLGITSDTLSDIDAIKQMLPEIAQYRSILTASILSPKDLSDPTFKISYDKDLLQKAPAPEYIAALTKQFCHKTVGLDKKMSRILGDVLVDKGAHVTVMLPPNVIDSIVRAGNTLTMENFKRLAEPKSLGLIKEAREENLMVSVIDDLNILNLPTLRKALRKSKVRTYTQENFKVNYGSADSKLRSDQVTLYVGDIDNRPGARPVLIDLPMDAILPIPSPTDPTDHLMYLVLLDKNGTPTTNVKEEDYMEALDKRLRMAINKRSDKDASTLRDMGVLDSSATDSTGKDLIKIYGEMVNRMLIKSLSDGDYGEEIVLPNYEKLYRIMLFRRLAQMETKVLVLPTEYVSYMAMNYNSAGIGESLIERNMMYASFKAVMTVARISAEISNSVPDTVLNIRIDEDDKSPAETIYKAVTRLGQLNVRRIPIGIFNPVSILDNLAAAGMRLNIDGGTRFPSTSITPETTSRSTNPPSTEIEEFLSKNLSLGFNIPPELVDQSLQGDFATGIRTSFHLFSKDCMTRQAQFVECYNKFMHKYTYLDSELMELTKAEATRLGVSIDTLIEAITLQLPSADAAAIENKMEQFTAVNEFIDLVVEKSLMSDELMRGFLDDSVAGANLDTVRSIIAAEAKRRYIEREGIYPELMSMLKGENGTNFADDVNNHHHDVFNAIAKIIKNMGETKKKLEEAIPADATGATDATSQEDSYGTFGDDVEGASEGTTPADEDTDLADDNAEAATDDAATDDAATDEEEEETEEEVPADNAEKTDDNADV